MRKVEYEVLGRWLGGQECLLEVVSLERKGKERKNIYISLRHGSHSFTCKLHHACLSFVSVHQPDGASIECGSEHLIAAHYSFIDLERMKGWVGVLGEVTRRSRRLAGSSESWGDTGRYQNSYGHRELWEEDFRFLGMRQCSCGKQLIN